MDEGFFPFIEDWQIELGIIGEFRIRIANKILYHEFEFCLVEFGKQALQWSRVADSDRGTFYYKSLESDEKALVWFAEIDGRWQIGANHQEYEENGTFSLGEIIEQVENYGELIVEQSPYELKKPVFRALNLE